MRLDRLELQHWRAIEHCSVSLAPGLTLIEGPNEAGKSTLVEALRLLQSHQPIWVFDIVKREMFWANQAAVDLWGAEDELALRQRF